MAKTFAQKMEEAAGISSPTPKMPYGKGERIPQGGIARPWIGPRPWEKVPLIPRAKGGGCFSPEVKGDENQGHAVGRIHAVTQEIEEREEASCNVIVTEGGKPWQN